MHNIYIYFSDSFSLSFSQRLEMFVLFRIPFADQKFHTVLCDRRMFSYGLAASSKNSLLLYFFKIFIQSLLHKTLDILLNKTILEEKKRFFVYMYVPKFLNLSKVDRSS